MRSEFLINLSYITANIMKFIELLLIYLYSKKLKKNLN